MVHDLLLTLGELLNHKFRGNSEPYFLFTQALVNMWVILPKMFLGGLF